MQLRYQLADTSFLVMFQKSEADGFSENLQLAGLCLRASDL